MFTRFPILALNLNNFYTNLLAIYKHSTHDPNTRIGANKTQKVPNPNVEVNKVTSGVESGD